MSHNKKLKVGITHGDINGISYEVILKALSAEGITELFTPVIFGSSKLLGYYRKALDMEEFPCNIIQNAADARDEEVNLVNISQDEFKVELSTPTAESGKAALMALEAACEALKEGDIDLLVTAPINKEAMKMAGFPHMGHTEYLEEKLGNGEKAMMIFADENMRLALCTIHLPLKDVAPAITQEKVSESIRLLHESLRKDFGRERPLIAVLSLNPHAGDGGVIGTEESEAIAPAIEDAIVHKIMAFGPFAADGFFGSGEWKKYDGVLAMYHDQGLAPFKLLSGTSGVNFTAGLPYVRTSPDHGTGYDIAGKNLADPTSLRNAIYTGIDIYRRRRDYLRAKAHPLRKQLQDKGGDRVKLDLTKDPTPADEPLGI